jgi:protein TonB
MSFPAELRRRVVRAAALALAAFSLVAPAPAHAAKRPPPEPAPDFPSGYEPDLLRSRLASPDSADVARACGNLRMPWGYRGWIGREHAMRSYGRRAADAAWARRTIAALLDSAAVDTIYRAPGLVASCKPGEGPPIYVVRVWRGRVSTSLLLRFDLGVATVFADEAPLGMIVLGARADTLWARLAEVLEDDPALRSPPPAPSELFDALHATGEAVTVDAPPEAIGRGREAPEYPEALVKQGIQGTVHVLTRVDDEGQVEDAVVHAGHSALRDLALEMVWGMRFKPARLGGKPVAAWTMVPVEFRVH